MQSADSPLTATDDDRPFSGLNVVDLSQGVAGPHCGMLFAQNGANVIKIEPPGGDWGRAIGVPYGDFCAYNIAFNRGKRSLAVDLKSDLGLDATRQLLQAADVVVENYRPGVLQRFGLDYTTLCAANQDVVYVSITGFGQTGPRASLPATDAILQSFSGLMSVNRSSDGMPQRVNVLLIDVVTGLYAFQAASTALYKRAMRGGGRHISVSLMEAVGALQAGAMIEHHLGKVSGKAPLSPAFSFAAADGYVTINLRRDAHFKLLCRLLECEELAGDVRFSESSVRIQHADALLPVLNGKLKAWKRADLIESLTELDLLHAPVNDYDDYFDDAHVKELDAVHWLEHAGTGSVPIHAIPGLVTPSEGPLAHSPALGEHSLQILRELGIEQSSVDAALTAGAVKSSP
ncbi:MAG: crotonobetainyl-CoA:carnitine CoA-transferase CaiB-like acyl-CoA transferase [Gammaproteobacteria bacterium]|jgi:crotonobetainyl-CoA:carnitine CoA-transferase CaiB-like acyl-CoA transferase